MKQCSQCKLLKEYDGFHKNKDGIDGYASQCKSCRNKNYTKQKNILSNKRKEYYEKNKDLILKKQKDWYEKNKEKIKEKNKEKKYCKKVYNREYYLQNKKREIERSKLYKKNNYEDRLEYQRKYTLHRQSIDVVFKLKRDIGRLVQQSLKRKGLKKNSKTKTILGVSSWEYFYNHLIRTFIGNYNRYPAKDDNLHIDHIIPLSTANTEEEVLKLNHYTNLQWLLAEDNMKKHNNRDWCIVL